MKTGWRLRRGLALLAALALALNAFAATFHSPPARATAVVDEVLGPLSLCAPGNTAPEKDPGESSHQGDCPLCTRSSALASPDGPEIALPIAYALLTFLAPPCESEHVVSRHLSLGGVGSRAPPDRFAV